MDRKQLLFVPVWKGECEGYAKNYMQRNLWRVQPEHDLDDLLQDSYVYFLTCKDRYPLVVEAAHFMALFRTCLFNHICYLSGIRTRRNEFLADDEVTNGLDQLEGRCTKLSDVEMRLLLDDAPEVVLGLIRAIERADKPIKMRRRKGVRETTNSFLCRISNLDPSTNDVRTVFENWIKGEVCTA